MQMLRESAKKVWKTPTYVEIVRPMPLYQLSAKCESPIEIMFLTTWRLRVGPGIKIEPQATIGRYRVDFLIDGRLVVECDGQEFHSSPTQKREDGQRESDLAMWGYPILRFTGAEIHRDVHECVRKAVMALTDAPNKN